MPTSDWVTIGELKNDQSLDSVVATRDDQSLSRELVAAMDWVEAHRTDIDYQGPWSVPSYIRLGCLRLAARWFVRRTSPTGMMSLGEAGSVTIPSVDPDIYVQLGITGGLS